MSASAIYLSPHYDDVCFSLAMTAQADRGGHLVNLFTACDHMAQPEGGNAETIRDAEDAAFARHCGLQRHNLGLSDASRKAIAPNDYRDIEDEIAELRAVLIPLLRRLLPSCTRRPELYCPLAVGGHRNHISTFLVIMEEREQLLPQTSLLLYEDLPYASSLQARRNALQRLQRHVSPARLERHANLLEQQEYEEKLALVGLYRSQHPGGIAERSLFTPEDPLTAEPHEAFWEIKS